MLSGPCAHGDFHAHQGTLSRRPFSCASPEGFAAWALELPGLAAQQNAAASAAAWRAANQAGTGHTGLIISVCCINWPVSQNSMYLSAQTDVANLLLCAHCVARFTCLVTKSHITSLEMASRYSKKPQMWLMRAATQASGSRYLSNPYSHDTPMGRHATTSRRIGIFSPSDA